MVKAANRERKQRIKNKKYWLLRPLKLATMKSAVPETASDKTAGSIRQEFTFPDLITRSVKNRWSLCFLFSPTKGKSTTTVFFRHAMRTSVVRYEFKKNVSASFPFAFLAVRPRNDVLILILCSLPFVPSTMAASTCSIFYFLRPDNYLWGALNFWYFIPRCEERCLQLFPLRNLVVLIWCMILATVRCVSWASRTLCLQFFVSSLCDRLSCKQDKTKAI